MTISHRFAVSCAVLMVCAASANAQIPDKFTNLKVLPKDISKQELISVMRGFSHDLGVRCAHCHTATNPHDLSTFNWASDQKPEKDVARAMMALAGDANKSLDKVFGKDHPHLQVTCFTCHHGNSRPETLAQALVPVIKKDGADAAAARYRELRTEYYGTAAYDFSEYSLVGIAGEIEDPAQVESARALLNLNLEFYPESSTTYAHLAETYVAAGDNATAMTHFEKALSLAPDNERLKQRIDAVKAGKK